MTTIAIVDYGMGNLRSVYQALVHAAPDANVYLATTPQDIQRADRVVLPGQGAMTGCMQSLASSGLQDALMDAAKNKPMLGVCVGEQMLLSRSAETMDGSDYTNCLNLIPGEVVRFDLANQVQADGSRFKVPQMGWNRVSQRQTDGKVHPIWSGIADNSWFYFVHSFYVKTNDSAHIAGETDYGIRFTSAIARDNIFATQFHPEKSAKDGLQIYHNFVHWQP